MNRLPLPSVEGFQVHEWIAKGPITGVVRGVRLSDEQPVVLKVVLSSQVEKPSVFAHEYSVATDLQHKHWAQILEIEEKGELPYLCWADTQSIALSRWMEHHTCSVEMALCLGLQLVEALNPLEERGWCHSSWGPHHILLQPDNQIQMVGMSHVQPVNDVGGFSDTFVEEELPYLSPEGVGRTAGSLDLRSNFYSLGVLLYRLLTQRYPFTVDTALQWLHAHVALQPRALLDDNPSVPAMLGRVIEKLLGKRKEDRYQTCLGLQADLLFCLHHWQRSQKVPTVPLGRCDQTHSLSPPLGLFGRSEELTWWENQSKRWKEKAPTCWSVCGPGGIGKTTLLRSFLESESSVRFQTLFGKFEAGQHQRPFFAWGQAVQGWIQELFVEDSERWEEWVRVLQKHMGESLPLLFVLCPELRPLFAQRAASPKSQALNAVNQWLIFWEKLFRFWVQHDQQMLLVLEDWQWSDQSSLQLLEWTLSHGPANLGILLSYRDDDASLESEQITHLGPLLLTHNVESLKLSPLCMEALDQWLTVLFPISSTTPLSPLIYRKAGGNPLVWWQLFRSGLEDGWLKFHPPSVDFTTGEGTPGRWEWNLEQLQMTDLSEHVATLVARRVETLPPIDQELLSWAACLGRVFSVHHVWQAMELSRADIVAILHRCIQQDILALVDGSSLYLWQRESSPSPLSSPQLRFLHDSLQQHIYEISAPHKQSLRHLRLAQFMQLEWCNLGESEGSLVFAIAEQWSRAQALKASVSSHDCRAAATIFRSAAQQARKVGAFADSLSFAKIGLAFLSKKDAQTEHEELNIELSLLEIEGSYLSSQVERAEELSRLLYNEHRTNSSVCERIERLQIVLHTSLGNHKQALSLGLDVLKRIGISIPMEPGPLSMIKALLHLRLSLSQQTYDSLFALPEMKDPNALRWMEILMELSVSAFIEFQQHAILIAIWMLRLTLRYGLAPTSSYGFMIVAVLQIMRGKLQQATMLGEVALELDNRFPRSGVSHKLLFLYPNLIQHWSVSAENNHAFFQKAHTKSLEVGDLNFAEYSLGAESSLKLVLGKPLADVLASQQRAYRFAFQFRGKAFLSSVQASCLTLMEQYIRALEGGTLEATSLSSVAFSEEDFLQKCGDDEGAMLMYCAYKQTLYYLADQPERAWEFSERGLAYIELALGTLDGPEFFLYTGLSLLCLRGKKEGGLSWKQRRVLHRCFRMFRSWSQSNPTNFQYKLHLLEGESARLRGDFSVAMQSYHDAAMGAKAIDALDIFALSNELLLQHYHNRHHTSVARLYLQEALQAYRRWGALTKVSQLMQSFASLLSFSVASAPGSVGWGSFSLGEQRRTHSDLDLHSVTEAAASIASISAVEQLLDKLMKLLVRSAGATSGVLLLLHDERLRVAAVLPNVESEVSLQHHLFLSNFQEAPHSILRYVWRTEMLLKVENAHLHQRWSKDPYLNDRPVASMLVVPILQQGKLFGLVYLENRWLPDAFSEERVTLVQALATQSAVSLSNAQLFEELEQRVLERTQQLHDINEALEQRLEHLTETQVELIRSGRMASLMSLVGGISHEMNNPANYLQGGALNIQRALLRLRIFLEGLVGGEEAEGFRSLLNEYYEPLDNNMTSVLDGVERIQTIVTDLRTFSRFQEAEFSRVDLSMCVRSTCILVQNQFQQVDLEWDVPDSVMYECQAVQINQALEQVLINACQAIEEKRTSSTSEGLWVRVRLFMEDERVGVCISDNGDGISEDVQHQIFDPFFTTREVGSGRGLGLTIALRIIQEHHGALYVESEPGYGTTVRIWLPR